jgi:hypothetical protein
MSLERLEVMLNLAKVVVTVVVEIFSLFLLFTFVY